MRHLIKFTFIVFIAVLATGCASVTQKPQAPIDTTVYRQSMPKSILVLPPINNTPDVRAPNSFWSTVSYPIAEAGYYVYPIALVSQTFRENGVTTPEDAQSITPTKLREIFGADAALYITVKEYGSKYQVVASTTTVAAEAKLIDLRSNQVLWKGTKRQEITTDHSQGGLVGMLVGALVDQIASSLSDRGHDVSVIVSNQLLMPNDREGDALLHGPRSPKYQASNVGIAASPAN